LWSNGGDARGQGVYYPVHRTSQGTQPTTVIRGQDAGELPPLEDDSDTLELAPVVDLDVSKSAWFSEGGWYSAVDVGMMKRSDSLFGIEGTWGETAAAPRFTVGWENGEGVGVRGELWHFESESLNPVVDRVISSTLLPGVFEGSSPLNPRFAGQPREEDVTSFDLDVYKRLNWGRDDITFGTGTKAISQNWSAATTNYYWGSMARRNGVGISLFTNARKSLYATDEYDVAFITEGRASYLWGGNEYSDRHGSGSNTESFAIYEGSAGVEWRRELPNSVVYLRTEYETQLWDVNGNRMLGFTGANVSLGITW
jgi:hypothetical protein